MRMTQEAADGAHSPDERTGPTGGHDDGLRMPEPRVPGSPLDWRTVLARLAPVRRRWDLAILANLARDIGNPAGLLEVINAEAGNGQQLSPQVLSERLRRLGEAGYVGYAEVSRIPRRRKYWLLPRGRHLLDALTQLYDWYEAQAPCDAAGCGQPS
jgi:DNA-binding HxlR family transcriptional regulator